MDLMNNLELDRLEERIGKGAINGDLANDLLLQMIHKIRELRDDYLATLDCNATLTMDNFRFKTLFDSMTMIQKESRRSLDLLKIGKL